MYIFSRILLNLDLVLSMGECICSKGVNIMSRLLIEISKEKLLIKINIFYKRISRRTMVVMIQTVQQSNIIKKGFYSNNTFTVAKLLVKISSAKTVVTWAILTVKIFLRIFFRRLKLSSFS